jgi:hypothetical protein
MWEFLKLAEAMSRPTKIKVVCRPDLVPERKMYVFDMREIMFGLDRAFGQVIEADEDVTKVIAVNDPRDEFKIRQIIEERGEELHLELVD